MPPDRQDRGKAAERVSGSQGEIFLEYKQVGQAMKVTAVDAATGTEVVIMGPVTAAQSDLQKVAVRKLQARLRKLEPTANPEDSGQGETPADDKGWIA